VIRYSLCTIKDFCLTLVTYLSRLLVNYFETKQYALSGFISQHSKFLDKQIASYVSSRRFDFSVVGIPRLFIANLHF